MARPKEFESPAFRLGGGRSILLSYGRIQHLSLIHILKLCNLLYLLFVNRAAGSEMLDVTQEDLADILGVSRVNLARNLAALRAEGLICTHRRCIEVLDAKALARHCSLETLQPLAE